MGDTLPPIQDNGRTAFEYFISQGLSPQQAAGIVGNLQGESGQGLNTAAVSRGDGRDGSDSIGIAQWNGERAAGLKAFAASKGVPWNDLTTQLAYLHSELQGRERGAYQALLASQTPEAATRAMLSFERPKNWDASGSYPDRVLNAARAFHTYGGGPLPAGRAAPLNAIPDAAAPIFGQPAQGAQNGAQNAPDPALFEQIPMGPSAPMFPQPRRPIDLAKLRAAFQQPNYYRG